MMGRTIHMTAGTKSAKAPSNYGGPATASAKGSAKGSSTGPTSKTDKGAKSRKIDSGICTKRLMITYELLRSLGPDGPFGTIKTPADVTALCRFVPPESVFDANFGCPFLYIPEYFGFLSSEEEYKEIFSEPLNPNPDLDGEAFWNVVKYCQCHQGYDLGCAAKIPHGPPTTVVSYEDTGDKMVNGYSEFIPGSTPADRAEYCKMVGVWNGDFDADVASDLSQDVMECGCFWLGTAQDMAGTCPGVDLGAFFNIGTWAPTFTPTFSPTSDPTRWPTYSPTALPTSDPTELPTEVSNSHL